MIKLILILVLATVLFLFHSTVIADGTFGNLSWNPNTETDLAGYRLYHSTQSGGYILGKGKEIADIPVGTETVKVPLSDGAGYYVLTAYDTAGYESDPSVEVSTNPKPGAPQMFILLKVTVTHDVEVKVVE